MEDGYYMRWCPYDQNILSQKVPLPLVSVSSSVPVVSSDSSPVRTGRASCLAVRTENPGESRYYLTRQVYKTRQRRFYPAESPHPAVDTLQDRQ